MRFRGRPVRPRRTCSPFCARPVVRARRNMVRVRVHTEWRTLVEPVANLRRVPSEAGPSYAHDDLTETQLLFGECVRVREEEGEWSFVEAVEQEVFRKHSRWEGYPGWVWEERPKAYPGGRAGDRLHRDCADGAGTERPPPGRAGLSSPFLWGRESLPVSWPEERVNFLASGSGKGGPAGSKEDLQERQARFLEKMRTDGGRAFSPRHTIFSAPLTSGAAGACICPLPPGLPQGSIARAS